MKIRKLLACLAAGLAAASATLLLAGVALAHAPITSVAWDNATHPTKVIATSGEDEISDKPGSFYLKVFDGQNNEVDLGDTAVDGSNPLNMSVSVKPNLPPGTYRVDWMTVSADDGDEADSLPGDLPSLSLQIAAPAPAPAPAPAGSVAPSSSAEASTSANPSTTTSGAMSMSSGPATNMGAMSMDMGPMSMGATTPAVTNSTAALSNAMPSGPLTIETHASGAQVVPPISSPVSAFARLQFDPAAMTLKIDLTVSGVSADQITAAHIHRGASGTNGGHAFDIIDKPFTQTSATWHMTPADAQDLLAGNLYLQIHSIANPAGAARGQIVVAQQPALAVASHSARPFVVIPPNTGDGGLLANRPSTLLAAFGLLATLLAGASVFTLAGKRS